MEMFRPLKDVPEELHRAFRNTFGTHLSNYWDITGFDNIKFDEEFIKPPDGKSTSDIVREKYGDKAVELIEGLLGKTKENVEVVYPDIVQDKYFIALYKDSTQLEYVETKGTKVEFYNFDTFLAHPIKEGKSKRNLWGIFEGKSGAAVLGVIDAVGKENAIAKFKENMNSFPDAESMIGKMINNFCKKWGNSPRYRNS
jgi:hypothetical protein